MSMFFSSSFAKAGLQTSLNQRSVAQRRVAARAEDAKTVAPPEPAPFVPPTIPKNIPSPYMTGGDMGLGNKARIEEFYVIMWEADKEHIFEVPAGGIATMRVGKNMMKFARKEQCLALTTALRQEFKYTPMFWRVFPNGEVQFLHPSDGQYPEKVTVRSAEVTNQVARKIWIDPRESERLGLAPLENAPLKFTGKSTFDV